MVFIGSQGVVFLSTIKMDHLCLDEIWFLKESDVCLHVSRPYQLLVVNSKGKTRDTKEWVCEVLNYRGDGALLNEFEQWNVPRFPLNGYMLKEKGVPGEVTEIHGAWADNLKLIHAFETLKIESLSKNMH
jgi:hypothetical protein